MCKNPDCTLHTPVAHTAMCGTSGNTKCKDDLHTKTCHNDAERGLVGKVIGNYVREEDFA